MTGFFNLDKEAGISSTFAVNRIKRLTHTPCGHMGTLDPLASGVLPVGVGNAARLFDYFLSKQKVYLARFRFGVTSDTLDNEGEKIYGGRIPSETEIAAALPALTGKLMQIPPKYSAKCVNGKRGYELARSGEEFTLAPKEVVVEKFTLIEQTAPDEFAFEITCGGGTYIRSLARDLAALLDTQGYMSALRRTKSGIFTLENAVPLETLTEENIWDYLIPTEQVLPFPKYAAQDKRIFQGVSVPCGEADGEYKLFDGDLFYGICRAENGRMKAVKKLC